MFPQNSDFSDFMYYDCLYSEEDTKCVKRGTTDTLFD